MTPEQLLLRSSHGLSPMGEIRRRKNLRFSDNLIAWAVRTHARDTVVEKDQRRVPTQKETGAGLRR